MKQQDEFKIVELLIINKASIEISTYQRFTFVFRCRGIDLSKMVLMNMLKHTCAHTHIYIYFEPRHENEKRSSVPWQWESFEGPSLVDPAGTPNEKPPNHPSWDATQQNITRSHRQFRTSAVVKRFPRFLKKRLLEILNSPPIFSNPFETNFLILKLRKIANCIYTCFIIMRHIIFGYKMRCRRIFNVVPFHDALYVTHNDGVSKPTRVTLILIRLAYLVTYESLSYILKISPNVT